MDYMNIMKYKFSFFRAKNILNKKYNKYEMAISHIKFFLIQGFKSESNTMSCVIRLFNNSSIFIIKKV